MHSFEVLLHCCTVILLVCMTQKFIVNANYEPITDSPIQIISIIQTPTGIQMIPRRNGFRGARINKYHRQNLEKKLNESGGGDGGGDNYGVVNRSNVINGAVNGGNVGIGGVDGVGDESAITIIMRLEREREQREQQEQQQQLLLLEKSRQIQKHPTNKFGEPFLTPQMMGNQRGARLHLAPGAYPVYYALARANGLFQGHSIRSYESKANVNKVN